MPCVEFISKGGRSIWCNILGKLIKTAVIGAGASGLTTTKCLTEPGSGFECTTFELSNSVGGTWVYTEDIGQDKYGLPVHSSMYQNLRYESS